MILTSLWKNNLSEQGCESPCPCEEEVLGEKGYSLRVMKAILKLLCHKEDNCLHEER
jgi:hypothetical protein